MRLGHGSLPCFIACVIDAPCIRSVETGEYGTAGRYATWLDGMAGLVDKIRESQVKKVQ